MDTIEKILANAKPSITKTHERVAYFWEDRWALSTRYLELVHYISDDQWEGYLTVFGKTCELTSADIEFVRDYLDLYIEGLVA